LSSNDERWEEAVVRGEEEADLTVVGVLELSTEPVDRVVIGVSVLDMIRVGRAVGLAVLELEVEGGTVLKVGETEGD